MRPRQATSGFPPGGSAYPMATFPVRRDPYDDRRLARHPSPRVGGGDHLPPDRDGGAIGDPDPGATVADAEVSPNGWA